MSNLIRACALMAAFGASCSAVSRPVRPPEVWLGHNRAEPLGRDPAGWPTVQRRLDAFQCGINAVAFLTPQEDLRRLAAVMRRNRVRIAVECGYFDWEPAQEEFSAPNPKPITDRPRRTVASGIGEITARIEMAKIAPMVEAGMPPDYLVLDGPVRRLIHPASDTGRATAHGEEKGLDTVEEALDEIIAYMRAWRKRYPRIRFLALTNFPNWGWKGDVAYWASGEGGMFYGDYFPVVRALIDRTRAARMPLDGLVIDNPYEYAIGAMPVKPPYPKPAREPSKTDWMARVIDLERYAEGRGLKVSLIVNSQRGGHESDEAFARLSLEFLRAFRAAGGSPARYVFQTWYGHPKRLIPESDPHTMTGMLKAAIAIIKDGTR